ncbi:MAG: ribonuclease III [Lachnospiraceae bacterium]|nr:ribonuclease III [Lachnospiraceae bacterium]
MDSRKVVKELEENIGYTFKDESLLLEAVTHSSFTNEMKINKRNHYERLEFLGDAVLELISSEYLYDKYPTVPEGGLSKKRASLVCEPSLAICARRMNLGKYIFFGRGEESAGGRERDSILADVTEAILGAIYLDSGLEESKHYVYNNILNILTEDELFVDSKTILQEKLQEREHPGFVEYKVVSESGPEHDKTFVVEAIIDGVSYATGSGKTKKAAQQAAARKAILAL